MRGVEEGGILKEDLAAENGDLPAAGVDFSGKERGCFRSFLFIAMERIGEKVVGVGSEGFGADRNAGMVFGSEESR